MSDLRGYIGEQIARLDGPDGGDAYHNLIEHRDAAPWIVDAYRRETVTSRRVRLLEVISYFALPENLPLLGEAPRDAEPAVWKEALNGLFRLGGESALRLLETVRGELAAASPPDGVRIEWIVEAREQVEERLRGGA